MPPKNCRGGRGGRLRSADSGLSQREILLRKLRNAKKDVEAKAKKVSHLKRLPLAQPKSSASSSSTAQQNSSTTAGPLAESNSTPPSAQKTATPTSTVPPPSAEQNPTTTPTPTSQHNSTESPSTSAQQHSTATSTTPGEETSTASPPPSAGQNTTTSSAPLPDKNQRLPQKTSKISDEPTDDDDFSNRSTRRLLMLEYKVRELHAANKASDIEMKLLQEENKIHEKSIEKLKKIVQDISTRKQPAATATPPPIQHYYVQQPVTPSYQPIYHAQPPLPPPPPPPTPTPPPPPPSGYNDPWLQYQRRY